MRNLLMLLASFAVAAPSFAGALDQLSNRDASAGLKDALLQGAGAAVSKLGVENGFLGNEKVRIPLPDALKRAEGALRLLGMKREADELVTAMNRAAEQAVPEAKALLTDAVRNMTVKDAKAILTGGETAGTEYFSRVTRAPLAKKFLPIVTAATRKVALAEKYNRIAGRGAQLGLVDAKQAKIEEYVTQKALDGLYTMIGEQEKAIRKDPVGAATGMAQKVFGLLGR